MPADLNRLLSLNLDFNRLQDLGFPSGLTSLGTFVARNNLLTNLSFRADMTNLAFVDVGGNRLANLTLPAALSRLNFLRLADNKLTRFVLPSGLTNLNALSLQNNVLTNVSFSPGLIQLTQIDLRTNALSSLTLPADMTSLTSLILDAKPFATLVLSETLAATNLATTVATLQSQGVGVFKYPLAIRLLGPRPLTGAFQFGINGPPGLYGVFASSDLATWSEVGLATNDLGTVSFVDVNSHTFAQRFYRVLRHRTD
jgi:hypothetical protein